MQLIAKKGVKLFRDFYIDMDIKAPFLPKTVKLPTAHGGEAVVFQKTIGDKIQKYDVIATLKNDIPVYSPCSGYLRGICIGPDLGEISGMQYAVIESLADSTPAFPLWETGVDASRRQLLEIIKKAAIINEITKEYLYYSISPSAEYHSLLIDGVDEQPYDLSATATLLNYQNEVFAGARIAAAALGISDIGLLLMKNFRTAPLFRQKADGIKRIAVKGKYPAFPMLEQYAHNTGALRLGAQSCRAIYRAVFFGEPQLSHVVTVWGEGVEEPANREVMDGTPIEELLKACGAVGILERVIGGGVMLGYTAAPSYPLFRWDGSLTAMTLKKHHKTVGCINCGRCAMVCPMGLAPYYILRSSRRRGERRAKQICGGMCVFCGACSYVCPARIPLTDRIREYNDELKGEGV